MPKGIVYKERKKPRQQQVLGSVNTAKALGQVACVTSDPSLQQANCSAASVAVLLPLSFRSCVHDAAVCCSLVDRQLLIFYRQLLNS
jgi:hypothetical protein